MLHSTLPDIRPSQRSCGQLLGKAMNPMEIMTCSMREGKWPHLVLTLAVLCMELHTDPAVLSAQIPGMLYPFQCHGVIPTPPRTEMRALRHSCGVALSTPRGPSAVLKGQRVQVKESCIRTLRLHTFDFILSSAYHIHLQRLFGKQLFWSGLYRPWSVYTPW